MPFFVRNPADEITSEKADVAFNTTNKFKTFTRYWLMVPRKSTSFSVALLSVSQ